MYLMSLILLSVMSLHALAGATRSAEALTYPATKVGTRAATFVTIYNRNDEAAMRRYVQTQFDPAVFEAITVDELVTLIRNVWGELGSLTAKTIHTQTPTTFTLYAQAEKTGDQWFEAKFIVTESSPFKLRAFSVHPSASPALANKTYTEWQNLTELVREVAHDIGVPGMAVAVVKDEQMETAVWGVRARGLPDTIHHGDRFHFGSVTKSMTSTMIGRLVELGVIDWDTRIGDILSDIDMRPTYRSVTLEELLQHRGGIVAHKQLTYRDEQLAQFKVDNPTDLRAAYVRDVLNQKPLGPSGGRTRYSNAGYTIAGHMAERAARQAWETLVQAHVLTPLNLTSTAFGWPATTKRPDQPRGHRKTDGTLTPQPLDDVHTLGPLLAPAGDIHGSVIDLATYAASHLQGLQGRDHLLKAETIRRLHTIPAHLLDSSSYAAGWVVEKRWGEEMWHWHNGSAGTFYALVMLHPASRMAVVVTMNAAPRPHETVAMNMVHAIYRKAQGFSAN